MSSVWLGVLAVILWLAVALILVSSQARRRGLAARFHVVRDDASRVFAALGRAVPWSRLATVVVALWVTGALVTLFVWAPAGLVGRPHHVTADARLSAIAATRTAIVQAVGGAAVLAGLVFTARTFRLTRGGEISERYGQAIEQLTSPQVAVRVGGVFALRAVATKSRWYRDSVINVLAAHVTESPANSPTSDIASDLQAAMQVLAEPGLRSGLRFRTDLREAHLRGLRLHGADLSYLDLTGASLAGATLLECRLDQAVMAGADLIDADLGNSSLFGTVLDGAQVRGLNLNRCSVRGLSAIGCELATVRHLTTVQLQDIIVAES